MAAPFDPRGHRVRSLFRGMMTDWTNPGTSTQATSLVSYPVADTMTRAGSHEGAYDRRQVQPQRLRYPRSEIFPERDMVMAESAQHGRYSGRARNSSSRCCGMEKGYARQPVPPPPDSAQDSSANTAEGAFGLTAAGYGAQGKIM